MLWTRRAPAQPVYGGIATLLPLLSLSPSTAPSPLLETIYDSVESMGDSGRGLEKREELISVVATRLTRTIGAEKLGEDLSRGLAERVIDAACVIRVPNDEGERFTELITVGPGGTGGGTSVKPGNVLLKTSKLAVLGAKAVTSAVGVFAHSWLIPVAAIILWDEIYSRLKVDIQERDATVAWTLWVHRDKSGCVSHGGLLALVNSERATFGRNPMSQQELDDALALLKRLRCIEPSQDSPSAWFVREWVQTSFR